MMLIALPRFALAAIEQCRLLSVQRHSTGTIRNIDDFFEDRSKVNEDRMFVR
jgi:hypothetical protein